MTKSEKQSIILTWLIQIAKGVALLDITMGFGKTNIAFMFIEYVLTLRPNYKATIIVPTDDLKRQWEKHIENRSLNDSVFVKIVNSIALADQDILTEICIFDEGHYYVNGAKFSRVYTNCKSHYKIPMSGTWTPEHLISMRSIGFNNVYTITRREAEQNGWVNTPIEVNIFIDMYQQEKEEYDKVNEVCENYFSYFGNSFEDATSALTMSGAMQFIRKEGLGDQIETAREYSKRANIFQNYMQKRITMIQDSPSKMAAMIEITNYLISRNRKIITFSHYTRTADILTRSIHQSRSLHSNILPSIVRKDLMAKYKIKVKAGPEEYEMCSAKNIKTTIIGMFADDTISCINTVKSIDLGVDVPGVDTAVIGGRDSKRGRNSQRQARATRWNPSKKSLIVNVVSKGTKDEAWLKYSQDRTRVPVFNSISELINYIENV